MNKQHLMKALQMAALIFLIAIPVVALHLQQGPQGLSVALRLWPAVQLALLAFVLQLLIPALTQLKKRFPPLAPEHRRALLQRSHWLLVLLILFALALPFIYGKNRQVMDIAALALIYVLLALSLNIVVGFAGLLNLGHVAFYAIGAYCYAIMNRHGFSFWLALPLGGLIAGAAGLALAFPILRLRGDYLAIVTLAFGEIVRLLAINLNGFTGGATGISGIAPASFFGLPFAKNPPAGSTAFHQWAHIPFSSNHKLIFNYCLILTLCLLTLWIINRLRRMPIGRAWEALREDEIACRSLGINPAVVKVSAFGLGAFFAGLAGVFFAARQGAITPENFTFLESAMILAIVVLGGSQLGIILAALALTVLPEYARSFADYRMLIFGVVMVLMMIWRPQGLIPGLRPKLELKP